MELSSLSAIHYLAQPNFATIFRRLITFKVDVPEMRTEVDILASLERLETLEAHHLRLPSYPIKPDLSLVRTLRRMKIKLVSVQRMVGRTFANMEECTLIRPCSLETLAPGGGVDLPTCTQFTYDSHTIDVLPNFRIPKLDTLTVRNDVWNKVRGSTQLAAVWSGAESQVTPLRPRVLHLDTQCNDQHLINALGMLPELEELYLGVVRPDGLGKVFFGALCSLGAKKGRRSHSPSAPAPSNSAPTSEPSVSETATGFAMGNTTKSRRSCMKLSNRGRKPALRCRVLNSGQRRTSQTSVRLSFVDPRRT